MSNHLHSGKNRVIVSCCAIILTLMAAPVQSQKPVLILPVGHQLNVHTMDFSKDGKLIATGSLDNTFILWDARTGLIVRRTIAEGPVQQVLFTPDGSELLTLIGQSDAGFYSKKKPQIQKWNVKTGKMVTSLPFSASPGMQFLPRSGYLLVPDYSDDLKEKKESQAEMFDMTDPENFSRNMEKMMAERHKRDSADYSEKARKVRSSMRQTDFTDKKQIEAWNKQAMQELMGDDPTAKTFGRNITLVDFKSLKAIASLDQEPEEIKALSYNNSEYIITEHKFAMERDDKLVAWEVNEFINQHKEKRRIKAFRQFGVGGDKLLITSPSKGFVAVDKNNNAIQLWQMDKSDPVARFTTKGNDLRTIEFSPSGDTLYAYSQTSTIYFMEAWSTSNYASLFSYTMPWQYHASSIRLAGGGDFFVAQHGNGMLKLSVSGDSLAAFHGYYNKPGYHGFSKSNTDVYVAYNVAPALLESAMKQFQSAKDQASIKMAFEKMVEDEAKAQNKKLTKGEKEKLVSEKMKWAYSGVTSGAFKGNVFVWDLQHGGAKLENIDAYAAPHTAVSVDKNYELVNEKYESSGKDLGKATNKMLEYAKNSGELNDEFMKESIENLKKARAMGVVSEDALKDPSGTVSQYLSMLQDNISQESFNGPIMLLINKKANDTISLIRVDSSDWIMLHKKGYYMTSKNGARSLSYARGLEVMSFEQLDIRYNRPDIVLKTIGKSDPKLIEAYRNAYEKRIKRMGIDTTQFKDDYNAPEADFGNRDKINYVQKNEKLSLVIVAHDRRSVLDRFNVWVNEVPVFGKKGRSLKEAASRDLTTAVEITLSEGVNRIETSVLNASGAESYKVPLVVRYTPSTPRANKLYFVGIGIDRFADTSHNLQYCEKDIRDLARKFKERYGAAMETDLLFNEEVTAEKVQALKRKLLQSTEDDKVIIVYSGHGLLGKNYDYYLSTYQVNFNQPEQNGLLYDELENLADGIRSRKKLMLIDACHSGEVDKEEMQKIAAVQAELKGNGVIDGSKGIKVPAQNKLGIKNSFELMQELFVNIGRGTGATIISAAAGTQFALERGDLKNGVFTYSVLELINSGKSVSVNELKKYVSKRVSDLTKGLQQPTARNETQQFDWIIW